MAPRNVELQFGIVTSSAPTSAPTKDVRISTVSGDAVIGNPYGDLELEAVRGERRCATKPMLGYELIPALETRFGGIDVPSARTI